MNHALIGQLAGLLAVLSVVPYIVSILRGHTKPERMTYFIWFVVDAVTISSYIVSGARTTIWTGLVYVFSGLLIFCLSIKYGMGGFSNFDILCLVFALLGVVLWIDTKNALIALYMGNFVGLMGYLPTIKKAYFLPGTENTLSWLMTAGAGTLNLFALTTLRPNIAILPIRSVITQGLVVYLLLFPAARFKVRRHRRQHKVHALLTHPAFIR